MTDLAIRGFSGIHNTLPAERIKSIPSRDDPRVALAEAVNVDIDDSGMLARRAGQTLVHDGAAHSLWSNGKTCLFVADGVMYRLDEAFGATAIAAGLGGARVSYAEVGARVYHANGRVAAVVDEGRVRSWGIRLSDIDVAASVTYGNMPAGIYQFAMTLMRADGQESGTGLAQRIDLPDGAGIAFTWSVPADPEIVDAVLYVTQPNGETLLQAAIVDVEAGAYTYTGGMRSLPLSTQWLDAPPAASVLAHHKGRLYLAVGDVLYATSPLSYEHCDLRDYCAFDGSEIRLLAPVEAGLFVGTAKAVYFLGGATFAERLLVKKLDAEAVAGSVVEADGAVVTGNAGLAGQRVVLFATAAGICLGAPDGSLSMLTEPQYAMPAIGPGAAVLRDAPVTQYLLSMQT